MLTTKVIGNIITSQKANVPEGSVFLMVQEVDSSGNKVSEPIAALDLVGANVGELVLVAQGSSVRQTSRTKDRPLDAVILGIVDVIEKSGKEVYKKDITRI